MSEFHAAHITARSTVHVTVREAVDLETISKIVATIGGRYGCRTCGLLGVDIRLSGDPVEFPEVTKIPGVQSVSVE